MNSIAITDVTSNHQDIVFNNTPDQKEFGKLFNACYSRLCVFAFGFLRNKERAEDVVQECFLKLWERRDKIDWSQSILPYLYTSLRNSCLNSIRDANSYSELTGDVADHNHAMNMVIEAETLHEIHRAIHRLPPKSRDIFKALYIDGKKVKEISREMNLNESTIRSHKSAALIYLRRLVGSLMSFSIFFSR